MKYITSIVLSGLLLTGGVSAGDRFNAIKARLANAACVHFDFLSIIDSDVFQEVDTTEGIADIASDGRFNVKIGGDQYLYDLTHLYTYSQDANQVVIEQPNGEKFTGSQIAFVTRLDKFFETGTIKSNRVYRLVRKNADDVDLPDTLTVTLSENGDRIADLRYYDINGDLNTIVITKETTADSCRANLFEPSFPDSVERVKL